MCECFIDVSPFNCTEINAKGSLPSVSHPIKFECSRWLCDSGRHRIIDTPPPHNLKNDANSPEWDKKTLILQEWIKKERHNEWYKRWKNQNIYIRLFYNIHKTESTFELFCFIELQRQQSRIVYVLCGWYDAAHTLTQSISFRTGKKLVRDTLNFFYEIFSRLVTSLANTTVFTLWVCGVRFPIYRLTWLLDGVFFYIGGSIRYIVHCFCFRWMSHRQLNDLDAINRIMH